MPSVADWGGGMSTGCAPRVQLFAGNGWPHSMLWYHYLMPISCHFRSEIAKHSSSFLVMSLTRVAELQQVPDLHYNCNYYSYHDNYDNNNYNDDHYYNSCCYCESALLVCRASHPTWLLQLWHYYMRMQINTTLLHSCTFYGRELRSRKRNKKKRNFSSF